MLNFVKCFYTLLTLVQRYYPVFIFRNFIVLDCWFRSMIHLKLFFVYVIRVEVHIFFLYGFPVVPVPFVKKAFYIHRIALMPLLRIICPHNCESAPGLSILICLSVLRPGPYFGDYCSFLNLKSDSVSLLTLFFVKIVLAVLERILCISI